MCCPAAGALRLRPAASAAAGRPIIQRTGRGLHVVDAEQQQHGGGASDHRQRHHEAGRHQVRALLHLACLSMGRAQPCLLHSAACHAASVLQASSGCSRGLRAPVLMSSLCHCLPLATSTSPLCTTAQLPASLPAPAPAPARRRVSLLKVDVERAELRVLQGVAQQDWPAIEQLVMEVGAELGSRHLGHCTATSHTPIRVAITLLYPPAACVPPCHRCWTC